jgi:hypothetical protein
MTTATVIFNGIRFPFYLMDRAISWSKEKNADLQAIFLQASNQEREDYAFPSDIDGAEKLTDEKDAEQGNEMIISRYIKLIKDMCDTEGLNCHIERLKDSSLDEVLEKLKNTDRIFLDEAEDENPSPLANNNFTMKDLFEATSSKTEFVRDRK